jgi:hypothetical protein
MATYYFAAAFQTDDPVSDDGTHLEAQYGFGVDSGNGVTALGSSGSAGRTFEVVTIPAATGGQSNQFVISLCSDLIGVDQGRSFVRVSFRPAHDVAPAQNLALAPLTTANAQTLLTGLLLSAPGTMEQTNISNGTKYGLPKDGYSTQWLFSSMSFLSGQPPGTSLHFEITIEIAIVETGSTSWTYYKVDPEMQVDF